MMNATRLAVWSGGAARRFVFGYVNTFRTVSHSQAGGAEQDPAAEHATSKGAKMRGSMRSFRHTVKHIATNGSRPVAARPRSAS